MFYTIAAFVEHRVMCIPVLIPKLNSDPILVQSEEFFAQSVLLLLFPFLRQEILDLCGSAEEGGAVAPDGGGGVGLGYFGGVLGVPEDLGSLYFLTRGFKGEGRFVLRHDVASGV